MSGLRSLQIEPRTEVAVPVVPVKSFLLRTRLPHYSQTLQHNGTQQKTTIKQPMKSWLDRRNSYGGNAQRVPTMNGAQKSAIAPEK
jgi:hypothetical protein